MMQNVRVAAFTFSELFRQNQQEGLVKLLPPSRLGLSKQQQLDDDPKAKQHIYFARNINRMFNNVFYY